MAHKVTTKLIRDVDTLKNVQREMIQRQVRGMVLQNADDGSHLIVAWLPSVDDSFANEMEEKFGVKVE